MILSRNAASHADILPSSSAGILTLALKNFLANRRAAHLRNATVAELARLDDRALADIGIDRSQIVSLASHPEERRGH